MKAVKGVFQQQKIRWHGEQPKVSHMHVRPELFQILPIKAADTIVNVI